MTIAKAPLFIGIILYSLSSFAQTGFQPWRKPFKSVEIISQTETHLQFKNKKGNNCQIKLSQIEYYEDAQKRVIPNDYALYLTGRQRRISFETSVDSLQFQFKKPSGKMAKVKRNHLFSYHKSGKEQIVFKAYITAFDSMSVDAARSYAEGGRDARRFYKKPYGAIANFAIGAAGGYFLGPYGILGSGIYTGIEGAVPVYTKGKRMNELTKGRLQTDPHYYQGFVNRVKKQRALMSGLGGVAGFLIGWGAIEYKKAQ